MADKTLGKTIARVILVAILVVGLGWMFLTPTPKDRKYPDRIPVRFWHRWGGEWAEVVARIAERYNQSQTKYEVIPLSVPGATADAKFMTGVIGGDPPDVMSMWNGAIPNMAASNLLTPLETLMSPADKKRFFEESYPVIRDSGMFRGKAYGVTIGSDLSALYVNVDHLKEAGLDVENFPKTIEGVIEWGEKLHRYDKQGNLRRLGFSMGYLDFISHSYGTGFYDRKAEKLSILNPDNLRTLTAITEQRKRVGYDKVVRFVSGLNTGSDTGGWPFISGDLSITIDGQWRVEEIRKYAPKMDYRVIPIPPPKERGTPLSGTVSGNFMIIPTSARQKEGAWDFIRFWSGFGDLEASAQCYNDGGWLPLTPKVVETKTFEAWLNENPQFRAFISILGSPTCRPMPPVPYLHFLNDQIGRAEDRAVRGTVTPEEALNELERNVKEELRKRKELGYRD